MSNFEQMLMLQSSAQADDARNRVIPDDGWVPDTSPIVGLTTTDNRAYEGENRAYACEVESWWAGVQRMRQQGHFLP